MSVIYERKTRKSFIRSEVSAHWRAARRRRKKGENPMKYFYTTRAATGKLSSARGRYIVVLRECTASWSTPRHARMKNWKTLDDARAKWKDGGGTNGRKIVNLIIIIHGRYIVFIISAVADQKLRATVRVGRCPIHDRTSRRMINGCCDLGNSWIRVGF